MPSPALEGYLQSCWLKKLQSKQEELIDNDFSETCESQTLLRSTCFLCFEQLKSGFKFWQLVHVLTCLSSIVNYFVQIYVKSRHKKL